MGLTAGGALCGGAIWLLNAFPLIVQLPMFGQAPRDFIQLDSFMTLTLTPFKRIHLSLGVPGFGLVPNPGFGGRVLGKGDTNTWLLGLRAIGSLGCGPRGAGFWAGDFVSNNLI